MGLNRKFFLENRCAAWACIAFSCVLVFSLLTSCSDDEGSKNSGAVIGGTPCAPEDPTPVKVPFVGGPVIFSEIDPINSVYEDHEGGDAGWVELFNTSADTVDLSGNYLTNSIAEPQKWQLGKAVIPPQSFMLVFLSGKNYPDNVLPSDSVSLIGYGCWSWTDAQADPPGASYSDPLPDQTKLCFKEDNIRRFGSIMRLVENKELGWSSISSFIGMSSGSDDDVVDLSATNEILLHAYITEGRDVSLRLVQVGLDDWKGYELVFTGTGDSSTVYRARLPQGTTFPDLANVYGTRLSPESKETKEVSFKAFSYIARNRGHEPHASFKIKNSAGSLYLFNGNGEVMDSVAYPDVPLGKSWSYGTTPAADGSTVSGWGFAEPSPYGFALTNVTTVRSPALDTMAAFPPSGFYGEPFVVDLPEDQFVRCELGGTAPTESSPLMNTLEIAATTVVRCASFIPGAVAGDIVNRTYVFEAAPTVPAVFVVADPKSMFDPDSGIYMEGNDAQTETPHFGANYWLDKEIPAYVELLETGAQLPAFGENVGIAIFGNYSRANAKKSVAITFREQYGKKRLEYPLFPEFPDLKKFKVFLLRNNGSNFGNDYIRDMLSSSLSEGLGVDYQRGRASVVYYNGEYYGIHNIRERSTKYYFETHYGMDPDDIDLLKAGNEASSGSSMDYQSLMDWLEDNHLDDEANYAYVASKIDAMNFMNYMQMELFANNRDWPANNLKKWRNNRIPTLWKWFLYDMDFGFGNTYSKYKGNVFEFATAEDGEDWPNGPASTLLLRRMLENLGFKTAFVNRMATLLATRLSSERVLAKINSLMSVIEAEIPRDQKRWGHKASHMNSEMTKIKSFAESRPTIIQGEMQEYFGLQSPISVTLSVNGPGKVLIHGLPVDDPLVSVDFFEGLPVEVSALPAEGGIWMGWSDGVMEPSRVIVPGEITSLSATFK